MTLGMTTAACLVPCAPPTAAVAALALAPGPSNPVGQVWIGFAQPGYGLHGTADPAQIDNAQSHGCLRMTNWDARELAETVLRGVDVELLEE